ncbi:RdgB/HAM1 family non-canonical purine NTP pyrophosphatase [Albimonas sp. CAU 1670]|uniref:RdgB/HAM1 family non-canonical purine NTP pyrophosphatase n=1 Tax=Albimonas sp. CAU 1670 TaxID=3032599 RepID=UPI0023D9819E|nr:RdgB/HAM1 family non-canonical purine NTP pyrophosphatase [Albimonas sp. CAU 1670]MDF2233223.1 RdgB/HAM1 family non-canonical purine NTP pyrophosphatase [Albimonas sp. CAU 1670]
MTRRLDAKKIVVASHNAGKVAEIRALLAPWGIETVSAAELDFPVPDETEETFEGNAAIKALASAKAADLPALADDSGIEVDALGGAPGVHTADWAETPQGRDFARAMARTHAALLEVNASPPWHARFVCVLAVAWPDGHVETVRGAAEGHVTWPARGDQGHGYDPIFEPAAGDGRTFAEMTEAEKNLISHRAEAFAKLSAEILPARG